ncbi:hypothetical protein [Nitrososphaera viennensis]|nr:hypothetical protein [Nitrososphaera viennensis]UVS70055.1 hypothetical protein NWT39_04525 [Nitrososphaera viennensis]
MADVYDRLFENLSKDIPNDDTIALLKELLGVYRSEGVDGVTQSLKERLEKLKGD